MLALAQLIFQGQAVNTHFQKKALYLAVVSSLFIAVFSCLLLIFISDSRDSPPACVISHQQCWTGCCGRSAFWQVHPPPHKSLCCLLAPACAWLSQGCSQPVLCWLLLLCCFHGIHTLVLGQSPTLHIHQCPCKLFFTLAGFASLLSSTGGRTLL